MGFKIPFTTSCVHDICAWHLPVRLWRAFAQGAAEKTLVIVNYRVEGMATEVWASSDRPRRRVSPPGRWRLDATQTENSLGWKSTTFEDTRKGLTDQYLQLQVIE